MKNLTIFKVCFSKLTTLAVFLLFTSCGNYFASNYTVALPAVPEVWADLLGEPHWRVQWLDSEGYIHKKDISPGEILTVNIPITWISPVTAWPWWARHEGSQISDSEYNLIPGLFKPAGGFFPFDISGGQIKLSWEAGSDTVYYWELALANSDNEARLPANFDWIRFRELFTTDVLSEEVCKDPWLIDWPSVAERTIASGFDRRRLVPESTELIAIPVGAGPWYGTSPFAEPLVFEEETPMFPIRSGINVWVSNEGILRVSGNTWILTEIWYN